MPWCVMCDADLRCPLEGDLHQLSIFPTQHGLNYITSHLTALNDTSYLF